MRYILQFRGTYSYIKLTNVNELKICKDPEEATTYATMGDAIKAAIELNELIGNNLVKATML